MLTISLLFKKNTGFTGENSRILGIKNGKLSGYSFHMNLNIWGDFQILISVPLITKRMSNLYLSYFCEKVTYQKLRFSKFKKFVSRSVFGELQHEQISLNFQTSCCNFKNQRSGSKTVCGFTIILYLIGIMTF